jgi:hypothetical protein
LLRVTDRFANSDGTFAVLVKGAAEQLTDLRVTLAGMQLGPGSQRFKGKRSDTASAFAAGETPIACESLRSVLDHLDKADGQLLTAERASTLRAATTRIHAVIGC